MFFLLIYLSVCKNLCVRVCVVVFDSHLNQKYIEPTFEYWSKKCFSRRKSPTIERKVCTANRNEIRERLSRWRFSRHCSVNIYIIICFLHGCFSLYIIYYIYILLYIYFLCLTPLFHKQQRRAAVPQHPHKSPLPEKTKILHFEFWAGGRITSANF